MHATPSHTSHMAPLHATPVDHTHGTRQAPYAPLRSHGAQSHSTPPPQRNNKTFGVVTGKVVKVEERPVVWMLAVTVAIV
jgi:hypothetical protein